MKKVFILLAINIVPHWLSAQGFVTNNGANVRVSSGVNLRVVNAVLTNQNSGSITNDGNIYADSTFNQNTSATYAGGLSSWLWFEGTANQVINSDATVSIANLKIDNLAGATLSQNLIVSNLLTLVQGTLDLNSHNIDLGTTGLLQEIRSNNRTILDNTLGISQSTKGGYIRATNRTTNGTLTEIAGLGIHLANAGTVSIDRYHYKGTSVGNGGIKKVYEVSGTPSNAQMRIEFGTNELGSLTNSSALQLYHYNGTSWDKHGGAWANASTPYVDGTGINSFSPWTVGEEPPLPIELLNFDGYRKNAKTVTLHWQTASEINNKGFEVEMAEDNRNFSKIAFVKGAGNSNQLLSYQTFVQQSHDAYFRLKQIDNDGQISYSHSVFVAAVQSQSLSATIFPNPNKGHFTILCNDLGQHTAQYEIANALGQVVANGSLVSSTQNIILNHLPSGMYFVKIMAGNNVTMQKMEITQ